MARNVWEFSGDAVCGGVFPCPACFHWTTHRQKSFQCDRFLSVQKLLTSQKLFTVLGSLTCILQCRTHGHHDWKLLKPVERKGELVRSKKIAPISWPMVSQHLLNHPACGKQIFSCFTCNCLERWKPSKRVLKSEAWEILHPGREGSSLSQF